MKMILEQVSKSLHSRIGEMGTFSVVDLIQIMKELRYISNGLMAPSKFNELIENPHST